MKKKTDELRHYIFVDCIVTRYDNDYNNSNNAIILKILGLLHTKNDSRI